MSDTLSEIIATRIVPHVAQHVLQVDAQRASVVVDGVQAFAGGDKFLSGKVAVMVCYLLTQAENEPKCDNSALMRSREMLSWLAPIKTETWGILNFLNGLYLLKEANLLELVVSDDTLKTLQTNLDWRTFVNVEDLTLRNLPTNYYGVAFGIAKYRELLGWEAEHVSQPIFDRLMSHIEHYSQQNGYMDETEGEGRFDRYTVLLPAELSALLTSTGVAVPERLRSMLRKSSEICLRLANERGHGFSYGRSIGAYGDTCPLEVLSIAALLGVLSDEEKRLAYAYAVKIMRKFMEFWLDDDMQSVNMWEHGRQTDGYRHKGRILGENMSLCWQLIRVAHHFAETEVENASAQLDLRKLATHTPKCQVYRFTNDHDVRALAIIRDGSHVFSLPLINGGRGVTGEHSQHYFWSTPYLPIPFENEVLEVAPGTHHPQLAPRILMADGAKLMPIVYLSDLTHEQTASGYKISYTLPHLCQVDGPAPQANPSFAADVTYSFESGRIHCDMRFVPQTSVEVTDVRMDFATFSDLPAVQKASVTFGEGVIKQIQLNGLYLEKVEYVETRKPYHTSHGALKWNTCFVNDAISQSEPFHVAWTIDF